MDTSQYLPMFLAEARESLQGLNVAIVRIEEAPDDRETVDEIFRIAHSLKGMSATMGFTAMAALTHKMEDVLELLRQRSGGLSREAIDVLLACLDALEAAVGSIESHGEERMSSDELVASLDGLVRDADAPGEIHVRVHLDDEVQMPAVRAFMVLGALEAHGELLRSEPDPGAVDGFEGKVVEAWLSGADADALVASATAVADVAGVEIVESGPAAPAAAPEEAPDPQADAPPAARRTQSVRVDADRLDQLMHHMGELVVHRTHVESLAEKAEVPGLMTAVQDLTRASQALQAMVMQVRMIPVEAVFMRFPRLVRDLSSRLEKQVELALVGKETELDRTVVDALGDPLVHLVRNSLDHGLEPPAEREAAGKPATGRLEIAARHVGGSVVISVRDDGRGFDPARVAAKAVERGLISAEEAESVDMARAAELLFAPGFSTAEQTSDISGRGVGMDAVRTSIRALGGEVLLESVQGQGTTATVRLPLTLAIVSALLVDAGGAPYAIPIDRVERTVALRGQTIGSVAGTRMLVMDDGVMPLLCAAEALGTGAAEEEPGFAVLVRSRERQLALGVEKLIGQRELVTRPLPEEAAEKTALSGGAVLSDGEIALIVDCDALGAVDRLAA